MAPATCPGWIENTEGAKFWMRVFNDLKTRGVDDILIGVADGLKGFPEALEAVFPATTLLTCIVHLIRNSLDYASWKDRKALAAAIKPIYTAPTAEAAEAELDAFEAGPWGERFPTVVAAWRRAWTRVVPFFAFPPDVRRVIYTTNAIERACAPAQDHQDPRPFSQRRRSDQTDLAGPAQHHRRMEPCQPRLEGGDEPVRDNLRRPIHAGSLIETFELNRLTHKKSDTPRVTAATSLTHELQFPD
ncbi:MAG: transposase [Lysobacteraceae bacterium]